MQKKVKTYSFEPFTADPFVNMNSKSKREDYLGIHWKFRTWFLNPNKKNPKYDKDWEPKNILSQPNQIDIFISTTKNI